MNATDIIRFVTSNFIDPLPKIPGDLKLPFIGDTLTFLSEPLEYINRIAKTGDLVKIRMLGEVIVFFTDAEGSELLLTNKGDIFSNAKGWDFAIGDLFKGGLMLKDGKDHQKHRRIIQTAFKKKALVGYLERMTPVVQRSLDEGLQAGEQTLIYPMMKRLTLRTAGEVFFGVELNDDLSSVNQAISNIVAAAAGLVRAPIPFTLYNDGLMARKTLFKYFSEIIPERRTNPGSDLFSQLCVAESEEGESLTDQEIINHSIFILMAAHDTTASSMSSLIYQLAKNKDWQIRLRAESQKFYQEGDISYARLKDLKELGWAFKEVLRLHPPLIVYPRKAVQSFDFKGYHIPAGTRVATASHWLHRDPRYWSDPERFDPTRFSAERNEPSNPNAFIPFGGGKHVCIGLTFAEMQVKLIISKILSHYHWSLNEDYQCKFNGVPIQEPADGLPIKLLKL